MGRTWGDAYEAGKSKCKGAEAGASRSRNSKEASFAGEE